MACTELDNLAGQLERELARASRRADTNAASAPDAQPAAADGSRQGGSSTARAQTPPSGRGETADARTPGESGQSGEAGQPAERGNRSGNGQASGRSAAEVAAANPGASPEAANTDQRGSSGRRGGPRTVGGQRGGGSRTFVDQLGGATGGEYWNGPITGVDYGPWSDRLRDVEEMLDFPELRARAAQIRDRARLVRLEVKRTAAEPKWDLVQMQIFRPLVELRDRVSEELARRESKEALVPIDRDPVPTRYSELVRRYYERLGKSDTGAGTAPGK
jgi:hypothetical protein